MVFNKSKKTDKRKYHATLTLPIKTSDNEEFNRLRLSLKKSLKARDRRIKAEVKRILSSLPVFTGTFQIQKFISISGFEKFFEKEFNNLIKLNDEFDKDIDFVEIVPGSTVLLDFIRDDENIQLVYEFEARIRLETDLIDLLKKHVASDTRNIFITQAIPSNKVELAKQIIKLAKTINKNWSPNARTYSSEQAMFASRLAEVISPYDEDSLNLLDLSDQTKDFLENVWGKNYYVENLFLEALNKIAISATVPNADELIKNTNISINDPNFLDEFYGEISDWFEVYPTDENENSESKRVSLDYLLENAFKTNNFRRKFAGYLMTKNVNDK